MALPPARDITRDELKEVAGLEGVEVRAGDAVLIRTGWQRFWGEHRKYVGPLAGHPGPDREAAAWLGDTGIRVTGADNFGYDRRPSSMPAHVELMVKRGINIMENMCLDKLAEHKAYEFMFVLGQPRFRGGVQSMINPVAIR